MEMGDSAAMREQMEEYYKGYEDPCGRAVQDDELYRLLEDMYLTMEKELMRLAGGMDSEIWRAYEACTYLEDRMRERLALGAYMMGAADRGR